MSHNCLDRHLKTRSDKTAIIWESPIAKKTEKITYGELHSRVSRFAGALNKLGLKKGERAIIYMPMIPEAAIAMLGCARVGVIHSVVFGGFAAEELRNRIVDSKAKVVITATCSLLPGKVLKFLPIVRKALGSLQIPTVIVNREQHQLNATDLNENEHFYDTLMAKSEEVEAEKLNSNHPLYILYTSGTTGKPKGVCRDTGGTMVALMLSMQLGFGFSKDSVMFATSDIG